MPDHFYEGPRSCTDRSLGSNDMRRDRFEKEMLLSGRLCCWHDIRHGMCKSCVPKQETEMSCKFLYLALSCNVKTHDPAGVASAFGLQCLTAVNTCKDNTSLHPLHVQVL